MKCFYHSADLDGHCSGAIVKYRYPECELFGINYGQDFPWEKIGKNEKVFMVDFALQPFSNMVKLNSICKLVWIDHHKTAIDSAIETGVDFAGVRIEGQAGCELTWDYVCGTSRPWVVTLLGRYDVWDHDNPDTLAFQYGMRLRDTWPEKNMPMWARLFNERDDLKIVKEGRTILIYEEQTNSKFCKAYSFATVMPCYPGTFDDIPPMLRAICVNRGFTNSKVFDSVWNPTEYDIMITFCRLPLPKRKWTVSLYSDKPEIDCGAIAKNFGGGGHKGAAGFQCDELPFMY